MLAGLGGDFPRTCDGRSAAPLFLACNLDFRTYHSLVIPKRSEGSAFYDPPMHPAARTTRQRRRLSSGHGFNRAVGSRLKKKRPRESRAFCAVRARRGCIRIIAATPGAPSPPQSAPLRRSTLNVKLDAP